MKVIFRIVKWIKELGHFYIMFVPERSSKNSRSRKLSPAALFIIAGLYTAVTAFLGFLLLRVSPVDSLIFKSDSKLSGSERVMLAELDQRMKHLSGELENLRNYNSRLQAAIRLADSTLLDSINKKDTGEKIKAGGNIFAVFRNIFHGIIDKTDSSIFFVKPVNGFISRDFFPEKGHLGIDFVAKTGTPVYAAANGYVIFSGYTEDGGYQIILNHSGNFISLYKHCSFLLKKEKQKVIQGEVIALSGNSGEITTGPHLHFEIWKEGKPVNPKNLLIDY